MHTTPEPDTGSGAGLAPGNRTRRLSRRRLVQPISRRSCRRKAAKDDKAEQDLLCSLRLRYSSHI